MDLKFRLNLLVVLIMLLIATAGIVFTVINARHSVEKEVNSSVQSINALLDPGLQELHNKSNPVEALARLVSQIERQRHFNIDVSPVLTSRYSMNIDDQDSQQAPAWFVRWVSPDPLVQTRTVELDQQRYTLVLSDNPGNEITEAWGEARGLFYLLALQSLLIWVLCHFILGQALKPLPVLINGLQGIESGDYQTRLGDFSLPEYRQIADAFNHAMTSLCAKTEENHLLTQHSLNLQEQERQILARELHDEIAQSVTAIQGIVSSIEMAHPQSKRAIDTILDICDGLFSVVRSMMHRLRPSSLDELGLTASLQELINDWQHANPDTWVEFNANLSSPINNEDINIHVYRIVQESLSNISRHAQASSVTIKLHEQHVHSICLKIDDDGNGFDLTNTASGFGLLGIRERIDMLNGTLDINSYPKQGVTLCATIPVST